MLGTVYLTEILRFDDFSSEHPFWPPTDNDHSIERLGNLISFTLTPRHFGNDWIDGFSINNQKNVLVVLRGLRLFIERNLYKAGIADTEAIPSLILRASEPARINWQSLALTISLKNSIHLFSEFKYH